MMSKLSEHLRHLHLSIQALHPNLTRLSVALYDPKTDLLSSYTCSSDIDNPLLWYSHLLSKCPSLHQLAHTGNSRLIKDLQQPDTDRTVHTQTLLNAGYRSSYTLPLRHNSHLLGFVFFNSTVADDFDESLQAHLDLSAYTISLLVAQEKTQFNTLQASMKTAMAVTHERDPVTGGHLRRITDYTRFICTLLAPKLNLSDQFIVHLELFSSLHDIGKISVPDSILLKPGQLTVDEFEIMKRHTSNGRKIIDQMIEHHAFAGLEHIDMLRNIVEYHHENWDGSGYPHGLAGEEIPLEARIIAICDAFDALITARPYKAPNSSATALEVISSMRGKKLDPFCTDLFLQHPEEVDKIRRRHCDESSAPP